MDEDLKKSLIDQAGTYKIVESVLTDSKEVKANDIVEVPWTSAQTTSYDLNL